MRGLRRGGIVGVARLVGGNRTGTHRQTGDGAAVDCADAGCGRGERHRVARPAAGGGNLAGSAYGHDRCRPECDSLAAERGCGGYARHRRSRAIESLDGYAEFVLSASGQLGNPRGPAREIARTVNPLGLPLDPVHHEVTKRSRMAARGGFSPEKLHLIVARCPGHGGDADSSVGGGRSNVTPNAGRYAVEGPNHKPVRRAIDQASDGLCCLSGVVDESASSRTVPDEWVSESRGAGTNLVTRYRPYRCIPT